MENDFVKELGYLGFTMRLKRISDAMMQEGRKLYQSLDVDIEPNWFVIFKLLKKEGKLSVTEISEKIYLSHPSVITIINKMIAANYLTSEKCEIDSRKRNVMLSQKALDKFPEFEEIWKAGEIGVENALKTMNGLELIELIENKFFDKGFSERTMNELK